KLSILYKSRSTLGGLVSRLNYATKPIAAEVSGCATQMMNKLASSNVAVYPSSHFSINNHSNALLFGFGIIPIQKIETAFDIIQSVLD
ncbi:hypothetical protein R7O81_23620, partial [Vibrio sp. Vb2977]|nr:hypothetical protein [Vibrio sp. Vb2977]MDW1670457.1 hypothetical protein [Vibrio sp. Vb2978]MDW1684602.1 hypothetical protein [Vibrio sp. Vb2942]